MVTMHGANRGNSEDVIVEIGNSKIRMYTDDSPVYNDGLSSKFNDPFFTEPVDSTGAHPWKSFNHEYHYNVDNWSDSLAWPQPNPGYGIFLAARNYSRYGPPTTFRSVHRDQYTRNGVRQQITIPIGDIALTQTLKFTEEDHFPSVIFIRDYNGNIVSHATVITGGTISGVLNVRVGTTEGASDISSTNYTLTATQADYYARSDRTITFVPGAASFWVEFSFTVDPSNNSTDAYWEYDCYITQLSLVTSYMGGSAIVEFNSPWTVDQLRDLQWDYNAGTKTLIVAHPAVPPKRLYWNTTIWAFADAVVTQPSGTPWSGVNWPASCVFHEGRLWLGADPLNPTTIYGSRSASFTDFNEAGANSDDDPVRFQLNCTGPIQWMSSLKKLIIGTANSQIIGTADTGPISYNDFNFEDQSFWTSVNVQPVKVGRSLVYSIGSRKGLRTFRDQLFPNNGWDGSNLSIFNQEILNDNIVELTYGGDPNYNIFALLGDGSIATCVFNYADEIDKTTTAWWPIKFGSTEQALVKSVTTSDADNGAGSLLWMFVARTTGNYIETIDSSCNGHRFLDSCVEVTVPANKTITGLNHLNGLQVSIYMYSINADGVETYARCQDQVVSGNSIVLEDWVSGTVVVGLSYRSKFKTLPQEGMPGQGSSQAVKQKYTDIFVRMNRSVPPRVNDQDWEDRSPSTLMGSAEPTRSIDMAVGDPDYDDGSVEVIQDFPGRTEILAMFGKMAGNVV